MKALQSLAATLVLAAAAAFSGCATDTSAPLKARPVAPSAFLEHPELMKANSQRVPFRTSWQIADLGEIASHNKGIYVAPVETKYLRPVKRPLAQVMEGPFATSRPVTETTRLLRSDFINAFKTSPQPRLVVANNPGPGVLTLQLALIELNPTNVVGNAVKYGAPGGSALAPLMKGNIAIEGKVRDGSTGKTLFQFADAEQDPFAVVSLRDLSSYGHTRAVMLVWAKEFEELTRTPASHKVAAPSGIKINPF